ncbi:unnamed protein product, partial [Heterotrigona itama]
ANRRLIFVFRCGAVRCGVVWRRRRRRGRWKKFKIRSKVSVACEGARTGGPGAVGPGPTKGKERTSFFRVSFLSIRRDEGHAGEKANKPSRQTRPTVSADDRAMCAGPAKSQWKVKGQEPRQPFCHSISDSSIMYRIFLTLSYAEFKMAMEVIFLRWMHATVSVQRVESVSTRLAITYGGTDIIINLLPT